MNLIANSRTGGLLIPCWRRNAQHPNNMNDRVCLPARPWLRIKPGRILPLATMLCLAILMDTAGCMRVSAQQMIAYKVATPPPPYNYQWAQDLVDAHYIITLGEGFDPTVNYSGLRAKVQVTGHSGDPNTPGWSGDDDGPTFDVVQGVICQGAGNPTNEFVGSYSKQ